MKAGMIKLVLLAASTTVVTGIGSRAMGQYAPANTPSNIPAYSSQDAINQADANVRNASAALDQAQADLSAARQRAGDIASALSQAQGAQAYAQRDADSTASVAVDRIRYSYEYRDAAAQADSADRALARLRNYRYRDPRGIADLTRQSNDAHARLDYLAAQAVDSDPQARAARDNARAAADRVNQISADLRGAQDDVAAKQSCADQAASALASARQQRDALVNPYPASPPPTVYVPAPAVDFNIDFGWFGHHHHYDRGRWW